MWFAPGPVCIYPTLSHPRDKPGGRICACRGAAEIYTVPNDRLGRHSMELRTTAAARCSWGVHGALQGMKLVQGDLKVKFIPMTPPLPRHTECRLEQTCASSFSLTAAHFWILAGHLSLPWERKAIKAVTSLLQSSHLHESQSRWTIVHNLLPIH